MLLAPVLSLNQGSEVGTFLPAYLIYSISTCESEGIIIPFLGKYLGLCCWSRYLLLEVPILFTAAAAAAEEEEEILLEATF